MIINISGFFMIRKILIWLYKNHLKNRHMENGRYIITENFIFDVINKFNFKWIEKQIDSSNINSAINVYYKNPSALINAVINISENIVNDDTVKTDHYSYNAFPNPITTLNYFVDNRNISINIVEYLERLKKELNVLLNNLNNNKKNISYDYYRRQSDKIFSDVLEIYTVLLLIAETK